ncbi:MAG: AAA family ATPase [Actinomycetota bacterium]|nr:AAA family ATPase [Actinomycetota bacterium]
MLCPVLIGRQAERDVLDGALTAARNGRGNLLVVPGEAGVGKSRLAREATSDARTAGMAVLWGRAALGAGPFRAVAEAVLGWARGNPDGAGDELALFRAALNPPAPPQQMPPTALLAEAVVRVLRTAAGGAGCLIVLEDLHWADGDTLAVLDYLADAVDGERIAGLVTLREDEPSAGRDLIYALHGRRVADVVRLRRLSTRDVADMARACLHTEDLDAELADYLTTVADGLPFLVEELLATLAESGSLRRTDGGWHCHGALVGQVPESFAASVQDRLARLDETGRAVVTLAAILGRRFAWPVVGSTMGSDPSSVLTALRAGVAAQLVEPTDEAEGFRFRHALTRDTIVAQLLTSERVLLAGRAAAVVERVHPNLEGDWCQLAAELWAAAGNNSRAAELLVDVGCQALAVGALCTAEAALAQSAALAADEGLAFRRDDALLQVLTLAGRTDEAFDVGDRLLARLATTRRRGERVVETHLRLARAATAGDRWSVAQRHLAEVRRGSALLDCATRPRLDALDAHIALGLGHIDDAATLAATAEPAALAAGLADVACEALEVTGRCARERGSPDAETAFARAAAIAGEAGLMVWRIRALHELGTIDLFERADPTRLAEARDLALANGQVATAAHLELHISGCHGVLLESEAGLAAARRSVQLARRCHLDVLVGLAYGFEGNAHAQRGDLDAMEDAIARGLAAAGDNPRVAATCLAGCRAEAAALGDDRGQLVECLQQGIQILGDAALTTLGPWWGMWCLLAAVEGFDDRGAADEPGPLIHRVVRGMVHMAAAVRLGRGGQREEAEAVFAVGDAELAYAPWRRHFARRLVAPAALTDDWGTPAKWAREGLGFFSERGHDRLAAACRTLLHAAGEPVPRRGRGAIVVPEKLRAARVTSREADVLSLIGRGMTNTQIAEQLCLSRRTVESHVSNLLTKTTANSRVELTHLAATCGIT